MQYHPHHSQPRTSGPVCRYMPGSVGRGSRGAPRRSSRSATVLDVGAGSEYIPAHVARTQMAWSLRCLRRGNLVCRCCTDHGTAGHPSFRSAPLHRNFRNKRSPRPHHRIGMHFGQMAPGRLRIRRYGERRRALRAPPRGRVGRRDDPPRRAAADQCPGPGATGRSILRDRAAPIEGRLDRVLSRQIWIDALSRQGPWHCGPHPADPGRVRSTRTGRTPATPSSPRRSLAPP